MLSGHRDRSYPDGRLQFHATHTRLSFPKQSGSRNRRINRTDGIVTAFVAILAKL
jgi:hypothetical protein